MLLIFNFVWYNNFDYKLSILRKVNGWNQKKLSDIIQVSDKLLSKWETSISEPKDIEQTNLLKRMISEKNKGKK